MFLNNVTVRGVAFQSGDSWYPAASRHRRDLTTIGRASLAFVLRDVTRFTVLSPRLEQ